MRTAWIALIFLFSISIISVFGQNESYLDKKARALEKDSPFTKIINRELPATIEYEDDEIIAFVPRRRQSPVHFLIVPKKPISSINDIEKIDIALLGKMYIVAKEIAKNNGVANTGYRLSIKNNEDACQSVFHLHMHLIGGKQLGPMTNQDYVGK